MKPFRSYPKRNKFNAERATYNGYTYHSKKEAAYAMELDWRIKAGEVKQWTRQHPFRLKVKDKKICTYYIDFRAELTNGIIEYIEVKGFATDLWRLKWRITEATFEELTEGETAKLILIK